jgi:hypothetical protein
MSLAVISLMNCSIVYNVHIRSIPEGDYDIFYDKTRYGIMPHKGDTTIQFPKTSVLKAPILELKGVDRYGCFQFGVYDSTRKMINVKSFNIKGYSIRNCDIVFDMNRTIEANPLSPINESIGLTAHDLKDLSSSQIHYCVADLQLLQKGFKAYDYDNTEYKIMKKFVDDNITLNEYSWDTVNSDLTRRITLGLASDTTNNPDSLPYAAWDLAASQKIKYLVVFYGYSLLESNGVAPGTIAASVALSTIGILVGVNTGFFTIVYPTGKDCKSVMDSYCAIFSVEPNKCIYNGKASLTSFNNSNIEKQITDLYTQLFENIQPFFINNSKSTQKDRSP